MLTCKLTKRKSVAGQCVESKRFIGRTDHVRFLTSSEELQYRYLDRLFILGRAHDDASNIYQVIMRVN